MYFEDTLISYADSRIKIKLNKCRCGNNSLTENVKELVSRFPKAQADTMFHVSNIAPNMVKQIASIDLIHPSALLPLG
jgi:hypothetical protein